jgi:hypothetical protein
VDKIDGYDPLTGQIQAAGTRITASAYFSTVLLSMIDEIADLCCKA